MSPAWKSVNEKLIGLGVPSTLRAELRAKVIGNWQAMLLYGSWARGDADVDSDLDVLLVNAEASYHSGRDEQVSLAQYNSTDVANLTGTLFGFHLVRDGIILYDTDDQFAQTLAKILPPAPGSIIARVCSLTPVLDVSEADRREYIEGLTKVARYLLRTAMYARALDEERPCFSVREIALRNDDATLEAVLSSHEAVRPAANSEVLDDLRRRLAAVLGSLAPNQYGTLHGLIEGSWADNRELSNFAALVLAGDDDALPYDELPRVTL
jgi:predicted nucleotidyltransferase